MITQLDLNFWITILLNLNPALHLLSVTEIQFDQNSAPPGEANTYYLTYVNGMTSINRFDVMSVTGNTVELISSPPESVYAKIVSPDMTGSVPTALLGSGYKIVLAA